ncbi:Crp/Fnr family transcriptional regulator [Arenibacter certesii]|uniref:Crp/Fnr family transcriptional regulator n=1 Tax=Arenibacter certesii TaxID=228955 RepID=A0A918MGK5_9FLAO|nr:Crp/Fnr family transcriptional regulator [Arenibacter certesii]GGW23505.1 Crp/Fnr family transcriptional regulator [Arenibacter certesii]
MIEALDRYYGYLFEKELLEEIRNVGIYKKIGQGEKLMDIGDNVQTMPLLLQGAVKVMREDDDGNELLLYFIERGDTCAMTFSCCFGGKKSEIRAMAEMDTELLMIPVEYMESWMGKYKTWQRFILDSYHSRMMELMETVDSLAFLKMDERLLKHLHDKAKVTQNNVVYTTHQEIAYDLHTSRVVVSRLLKKMENDGEIELNRNHIKILKL